MHCGRLRPDEIVVFDGIRVTSVGRTLLDLGARTRALRLIKRTDLPRPEVNARLHGLEITAPTSRWTATRAAPPT